MSLYSKINKVLTHPLPALIFRLYIAWIFVDAGMYKINYSAEFAESIASYRMVPYWGVNLMAVTLPWIELICGICMALGIRVKSMSVMIAFLMLIFTIGVAVNLLRNSPISCGCFSTVGDAISVMTLLRDLAWLAMSVHVYYFDRLFHLEKISFGLKEMES